jgi:predicted HTH domain antitoxin
VLLYTAKEMAEIISTRVPADMAKDIAKIEKEEKADRATVIRKLLAKAIAERKLEGALTLFSGGKVTLWKASKLAGLSLWEMMEIVRKNKIVFQYSFEDFRDDFELALKEQ